MTPEAISPFGERRYHAWNEHVKTRYGGRVQKVSVVAGFTCPNRDGLVGTGGCTFCNNASFTPGYLNRRQPIAEQIAAGLDFLQWRYPGTQRYIAYFQSYSNTYGEFERLRACYEEALAHPQISGLATGTRPDCLPDKVLDYLAALAREHIIELEIGVESCNDVALAREWQRDPDAVLLLGEQDCTNLLADFIERLSPNILLQRVGSEVPPAQKLAPLWNLRLSELAPRLTAELARRGSWQGCRYRPGDPALR